MAKKYLSEALLITCTDNQYNIIDWLYWHLYVVKFDHVVLIDNSPDKNLEKIANYPEFKDLVSYYSYPDRISQVDIYTEYVNNSEAWWVLPIDDDEFLYLNPKNYSTINDLIKDVFVKHNSFYRIGFTWAMMMSDKLLDKIDYKEFSYIETYRHWLNNIPVKYNISAFGSMYDIKTMVNTCMKHLYHIENSQYVTEDNLKFRNTLRVDRVGSVYEHIGNVHNPITYYNGKYQISYNISNSSVSFGYRSYFPITIAAPALLLHFKYRSLQDWQYKCNSRKHFADTRQIFFDTQYLENRITDYYTSYCNYSQQFDMPFNIYNNYKSEIIKIKSR